MDKPLTASSTLDPVTFEVLRNAFVNIVDQMAEQVRRTCYSFVVYNRDFSNALCDAEGNTVAQGNQDLAAHVGTLHYTCKAVIDEFGDDIHPGDVFLINDPYVGGTHFSDTRVLLPIFFDGRLIAWSQANGHWADMGGSVPGSFDVTARDMFKEGIRVPPVKIWRRGEHCLDVCRLVAKNTRDPEAIIGDMDAQTQATRIAEREVLRLCEKYGVDTITTAFAEVQDYVERAVRLRLAELPDGSWETVDFVDQDPAGEEGLIPIRVRMTITGDEVEFDLTGSHPTIGSMYNCAFGGTFAAIVSGMKTFFPEVPLNAGLYRTVTVTVPDDTIVSARWPVAVSGFVMCFEKIMNAIFELFSGVMPERAMACAFNIEYLQTGGYDARGAGRPYFMLYDWLSGGWGGRNGRDGLGVTASCFGVGLMIQPVEGQERMCPVRTDKLEITTDSGGPGEWRGGVGLDKAGAILDVDNCVFSYFCDRERSVVWGIEGGLPSRPHGLWLEQPGQDAEFLGAVFSDVPVESGARFWRGTAGGGGFGDPLKRDPERVREDVVDDYVSVERARKDYGVVLEVVDEDLAEYRVDVAATAAEREAIRAARVGWLEEDAEAVAARFRAGELDEYDVLRRHGVICDWGTGRLLANSTKDFRAMMRRRSVPHWD
ncbi:MAG: hydantoinase B/oxoprolinase family protein [Gammaproteobacteria bacterium]